MQDKLVLFLAADSTPTWVTIDGDGQVASRVLSDDADMLIAAAGKEVVVVVPGEAVLLTSAVLPKLSRARLMQALPFAIEEQLTSDVETLHFVPAEIQLDGVTPIAVVSQEHMLQWQTWLQSWHIQPDSMIPTTFGLPVEEGEWHIAVTDMAVVRTGEFYGFSCDVPQLSDWLKVAIASAQKKPRQIYLHNYTGQMLAIQNLAVDVIENILPADQWYKDAAQQLNTPAINILSGGFASRKAKYPQMSKVRQTIGYLAGAWLALLLLYPLVSYVTLKSRLSSIQGQMWQLYQKQFPNATSMVAPKIRFEEKLHKAGSTLGQNRFLLLLAYVGEALHKASDVTIKRMEFQSNMLTMDLTATTDGFAGFTDYLSQQGLQVKQQNASVAGERVSATVQVEQ